MISVERSFYDAFPRLGSGAGRSLSRPVVSLLRRVACESAVNSALEACAGSRGLDFVRQVLERLDVSYRIAPGDRENIPVEGRVVIVANHPLGALDALALLHLVGSVRPDVRILANRWLIALEPLAELLIPCEVFGSGQRAVLRQAFRALADESALIIFPAGEVSRIRPDGVRDARWSEGFVRFAQRSRAPVVPVHIDAQNSAAFYGVSMLARPLATLMLPRELFAGQRQRIDLTVGAQIDAEDLMRNSAEPARVAASVRRHLYRIASGKSPLFATRRAIAHPEPAVAVRRALRGSQCLGETTDGKQILLLDTPADPVALREIGRLRELAFRRVGEGRGLARDLDDFDRHYRHIVLWDDAALEIAGAYRLAEGRAALDRHGVEGLYSASLFDFSAGASTFLRDTVELGRSFVQPRYWGSRSLDYLWQGIGAYLASRPELRYLMGPVSLSARLSRPALDWIVETHRHFFGDPQGLARARRRHHADPALRSLIQASLAGLDPRTGLTLMRERLQELGCSLPVLYRQYVELCEPDGVIFLDFGVDPAFSGCVDGLIRLDLQRLRTAKRERYLGTRRAVPMTVQPA